MTVPVASTTPTQTAAPAPAGSDAHVANQFSATFNLYQASSDLVLVYFFFAQTEDAPLFTLVHVGAMGAYIETLFDGVNAHFTNQLGAGESEIFRRNKPYKLEVHRLGGADSVHTEMQRNKSLMSSATYQFKYKNATFQWSAAKDCRLAGGPPKAMGFKLNYVPASGNPAKDGSDVLVILVSTQPGQPKRAAFELKGNAMTLGKQWCALMVLSAMKVLADNGVKPDGTIKRYRAFVKQVQEVNATLVAQHEAAAAGTATATASLAAPAASNTPAASAASAASPTPAASAAAAQPAAAQPAAATPLS